VREFSADYLETTREGMWADSRAALADLDLATRERVLDVGCGTGELTRVLAEETSGEVVGADVDPRLLAAASEVAPAVRADATRLPFVDDAVDLVVCQALLINLPDPVGAVEAFARVSSDLVAAVEPDNGAVTVDSTVDAEPPLARRARERFLDGVGTDVTLGAGTVVPGGPADVRVGREVFEDQRLGAVVADRVTAEGDASFSPGTLVGPDAHIGTSVRAGGRIAGGAEVVR